MRRADSPAPLPSHLDLFRRYDLHASMVGGCRLACTDHGDGPPVILLHGLGGALWHWEHQQADLARAHRVLTPDMPGAGLSDAPDMGYAPATILDMLRAFMDDRGVPRAVVIGHSMGAGLALGMSLRHPGRVRALVLLSGLPGNVLGNMASQSYKRCIRSRIPRRLIDWSIRLTGRLAVRRIIEEMLHDHALITPILIARVRHNRFQHDVLRAIAAQMSQLPVWERDFAPRLQHVTHPTLILWGARDKIFPAAVGRAMQTAIPDSEFREIPRAGHFPQWEQPAIVNDAILRFLRRLPA